MTFDLAYREMQADPSSTWRQRMSDKLLGSFLYRYSEKCKTLHGIEVSFDRGRTWSESYLTDRDFHSGEWLRETVL